MTPGEAALMNMSLGSRPAMADLRLAMSFWTAWRSATSMGPVHAGSFISLMARSPMTRCA